MPQRTAKRNRKAQLEIVGISIVVVLMIGAIFLALRLNKPEEKSQRAVNLQQANSYLSSVLEVTADNCKSNRYSVKDLIIDCKDKKSIKCDAPQLIPSCDKYKEILTKTLADTFAKWKKSYALSVDGTDGMEIKSSGCAQPRNEDLAEAYVPIKSGSLKISLKICY